MSATEKRVRGLFSDFFETAFTKDGRRFSVKKAEVKDAADITSLYESVAITKENAAERLSEGEKSFKNSGGMFSVPDALETEALIADGEEFLIVKREDEPFAFIRAASVLTPKERLKGDFSGLFGRVIEGGEIAVLSGYLREAANILFYLTLEAFSERGFLYHIGEVYRVTSYDDGGGERPLNLFNFRSFNRMIKTGARYLGEGPEKTVYAGGLRVTVRPSLVCWEVKKAAAKLKESLYKSGIEM